MERRLAAHALAEIGHAAREAVPALIEALRDPESFVRVWAAAALARVEPENLNAIPTLLAGTRDEAHFVRSLPHGTLVASDHNIRESKLRCRNCTSCSMTMTRAHAPRRWWH